MENSYDKLYVNISDKEFEHSTYDETKPSPFGYKPTTGFWFSLPSDDPDYFSKWDEVYKIVDKKNRYVTTAKIKPTTYILNPEEDEIILEGFQEFVKKSKTQLSVGQKRRLLVELIKQKKNLPDIEHIICQIDTNKDITVMERIFGGYRFGEENSDDVYSHLQQRVRDAFQENFSGVEVTGYALDLEDGFGAGIYEAEVYMRMRDKKYTGDLGTWEFHSLDVFDTDCVDVIKKEKIDDKTIKKREEDLGELSFDY